MATATGTLQYARTESKNGHSYGKILRPHGVQRLSSLSSLAYSAHSLPEHTAACCHRASKLPRPFGSRSQHRTADHIHSPPALNGSYRGFDRNKFRPLRFSLPQVAVRQKKTTCESENLPGPEKCHPQHGRGSSNHRPLAPRSSPKSTARRAPRPGGAALDGAVKTPEPCRPDPSF